MSANEKERGEWAQTEAAEPTPCTLNLRDAAKAPEPTYRDYAEIEKYRKSESPALGGSEICYLHVGLQTPRPAP